MQRNILFVYTVRDRSALEPVLCLKHNLLWLWSGTAQLREPVLFGTNCFVHTVRDRSALGACFVWSEILLCLRSGTAGPREPVLVTYTVRDRFALEAGLFSGQTFLLTRSGSLSAPGAGFIGKIYCYMA